MSTAALGLLYAGLVIGLAVLFALAHTAVEAAISRHLRRAEQRELFTQASHVRKIPSPREESSHR
jgi:hypothetical protein